MPLSDDCHGPYRMMPPDLLHTSVSGLILYMFEWLHVQIGCGKDRDDIDKYHIQISLIIRRQSERDFLRGTMRNGLINGTKWQAEETRGNSFLHLCIAHSLEGSEMLWKRLQYSQHKWVKWLKFLKFSLYSFTIQMIRKRLIMSNHWLKKYYRPYKLFSQERTRQMVTAYPKCMEWQKFQPYMKW